MIKEYSVKNFAQSLKAMMPIMSSADIKILLYIGLALIESGQVFKEFKVEELEKATSCSKQTVRNSLNRLSSPEEEEGLGLLVRKRRKNNQANLYALTFMAQKDFKQNFAQYVKTHRKHEVLHKA